MQSSKEALTLRFIARGSFRAMLEIGPPPVGAESDRGGFEDIEASFQSSHHN